MTFYQELSVSCDVVLQNKELWTKFHQLTTEMVITKTGRKMFPIIKLLLTGLDPAATYCVLVELVPVSKYRYKYTASEGWVPTGAENPDVRSQMYLHPDSPATGQQWMSQCVNFDHLKLTNSVETTKDGPKLLFSMHKYQAKIIIAKSDSIAFLFNAPMMAVSLEETSFIAVTAYQNDKVRQLKIDNNPFAKGFRENGQARCKRKRLNAEEMEVSSQKHQSESPPPSPLIIIDDDADDDNGGKTPSSSTSLEATDIKRTPSLPEPAADRYQMMSALPGFYSSYDNNRYYLQKNPFYCLNPSYNSYSVRINPYHTMPSGIPYYPRLAFDYYYPHYYQYPYPYEQRYQQQLSPSDTERDMRSVPLRSNSDPTLADHRKILCESQPVTNSLHRSGTIFQPYL